MREVLRITRSRWDAIQAMPIIRAAVEEEFRAHIARGGVVLLVEDDDRSDDGDGGLTIIPPSE